jgi:hypothetical protein
MLQYHNTFFKFMVHNMDMMYKKRVGGGLKMAANLFQLKRDKVQ